MEQRENIAWGVGPMVALAAIIGHWVLSIL